MKKGKDGFYAKHMKRALDLLCSLFAVLLFFWLFALITVLVRIKLGKPVLFRQTRPGKNGKPFSLCKFRTMTDQRDPRGHLLPDEQRLTPFGFALRKTSLDELPEVWNILIGNMSVVGPRPLLTEYLPYYTEEETHRHDVRPGLTGLAQISGRNYLDWDARIAKDVEYVNNLCFLLDVKIVAQTALQMIKKKNIAEDTHAIEGNFAEIRSKQACDKNCFVDLSCPIVPKQIGMQKEIPNTSAAERTLRNNLGAGVRRMLVCRQTLENTETDPN